VAPNLRQVLVMRPARGAVSTGRVNSRIGRWSVAVLLSLGLVLAVVGCGMNVQTNKPYTPAEGVNLDLGSIKIRNLMILSPAVGQGFLSASLLSPDRDALVSVSGAPIKADGSNGAPFTVAKANPVAVGNGVLVVLTKRPLITVHSPDLKPGLTASLVLTFSSAGQATVLVPVVDANQPDYATVVPTPSGAPSG
jgi:hypothetical protein